MSIPALVLWFIVACVEPGASSEAPQLTSHGPTATHTEPDEVPIDFYVCVERTPCYGKCPVAKTAVTSDGRVQFFGVENVKLIGAHVHQVSPDSVRAMWNLLSEAKISTLKSEYSMRVTDVPSTIISGTGDGVHWQVVNRWVGDRRLVAYPEGVKIETHELLDATAKRIEELAQTRDLLGLE